MPDRSQGGESGTAESNSGSRYQQYFEVKRKPPLVLTLPREALYGEPDSFGLLSELAVIDHRVIVIDSESVSGVALIDRETNSIILPDKFGAVAGFTKPTAIFTAGGTTAWLYSSQSGEWRSFDIESLEASSHNIVQLPHGLSQPIRFGYRFAATGIFAGELLRMYDSHDGTAELITARGAPPLATVTPELAIHLNRTRLAVCPSGDRLVLAFRYLSRLHVFNTQADLERAIAGPEEVELRYGVTYASGRGDRPLRSH